MISGSDAVRFWIIGTFPPKRRLDRYRWRQEADDLAWAEWLGQVLPRETQRFEDDGGRVG